MFFHHHIIILRRYLSCNFKLSNISHFFINRSLDIIIIQTIPTLHKTYFTKG